MTNDSQGDGMWVGDEFSEMVQRMEGSGVERDMRSFEEREVETGELMNG